MNSTKKLEAGKNQNESKYDLTIEETSKCLKEAELAIFMNGKSSKKPISVFVVAQPGAGKTGLRGYLEGEYSKISEKEPFIEFNPDEVGLYHKYYKEILAEFPVEAYYIVQRFVGPALDTYLRPKAVQLRTNIMQEGTLSATAAYLEILDFQKNGGTANLGDVDEQGKRTEVNVPGGYEIDVNVLAVHRYESLLSSYEREQDFIEGGLPPRAVVAEHHDRAYKNMLETIKILEQRGLYDRIRVFRRGKLEKEPELVYTSGDDKYPNVVEAILQEREKNKREIFANNEAYIQRISTLEQRVRENKNVSNAMIQLSKIKILKEEFVEELEQIQNREEQ